MRCGHAAQRQSPASGGIFKVGHGRSMSGRTVVQQDRRVRTSGDPEQLQGPRDRTPRSDSSVGSTPLYKAEVGRTTSSGKFAGIDVAMDKLDIAVLHALLGGLIS